MINHPSLQLKLNKRLVNSEMRIAEHTDLQLISKALDTGDPEYYGELYARYSDKVFNRCNYILKDFTIAQDCAQDIMIKVYRKLTSFKGKNFNGWVNQITYTHCIDYIRKNKKMVKEELEEERFDEIFNEQAAAFEMHDKEVLETKIKDVNDILDELSPDEKELLLLKYKDNKSINDLSDSYDLSPSAVKMKLLRTKNKVKDRYEQKQKNAS